jgi:hypothetical protein
VQATESVKPESDPEPEVKTDPDDPRIGTECEGRPGLPDPKDWSGVGYDDGSFYRCENGIHVERTL